jgi:hypothetical protein
MKSFKKSRSDSYEWNLSPEERGQLHGWLSDVALSLRDVQMRAPVQRQGRRSGRKPSISVLSNIGRRIRTEMVLARIRGGLMLTRGEVGSILGEEVDGDIREELLEEVMLMIAQEVIQKTLTGGDAAARTAATRLLLTRSEQDLKREKFALEREKAESLEKVREGQGTAVSRGALSEATEDLKLL